MDRPTRYLLHGFTSGQAKVPTGNYYHEADYAALLSELTAARAEAAEARVRELELDNAGRFEHIVKVEAERDALRERCEKLEWLVEVQEFYMYRLRNPGGWSTPGMEREKIGVAWQRRSAANDELRAMYLAATEVKP